ncbi:MAG TPA: DUF389 domain-containing protein, partial [Acidimicrobiia bacterium]
MRSPIKRVEAVDVARMRSELFFDGDLRREKLSRFWLLLTLSAVIAAAGVIADSTATVIGAMIVAPLMTPIMGVALAATLADRKNLFRSIGLVLAGVTAVVAVGWLLGELTAIPVEAATNSQVAGRVAPRLIDLVAALATGAVGAIALSRSDISDTLPGVAIAISLVPPLAVVGLTLEAGAAGEAAGALLLFVTNVTAILAMGTLVLALYGVPAYAVAERRKGVPGRAVVIGMMVGIVAIPLAITSRQVTLAALRESGVRDVALAWAGASGWDLAQVTSRSDHILVRAAGPLPAPAIEELETALTAEGLDD